APRLGTAAGAPKSRLSLALQMNTSPARCATARPGARDGTSTNLRNVPGRTPTGARPHVKASPNVPGRPSTRRAAQAMQLRSCSTCSCAAASRMDVCLDTRKVLVPPGTKTPSCRSPLRERKNTPGHHQRVVGEAIRQGKHTPSLAGAGRCGEKEVQVNG